MWCYYGWKDYELIDAACGERLERWGDEIVIRPDPMAIWTKKSEKACWDKASSVYHRSDRGGGHWERKASKPACFLVSAETVRCLARFMGFKHMGVFPEQAINWEFVSQILQKVDYQPSVLNLFAYTGAASVSAAAAGAKVCHVDAAKGMVEMAKENARLSGLQDAPIRYIVDDCRKFLQREIRRSNKYDGIILDPPSYGRGSNGEVWKIEDELPSFLELCRQVLTEKPLFVMLNSYTTGISAEVIKNLLSLTFDGHIEADEIGLPITSKKLIMPCGVTGRVTWK